MVERFCEGIGSLMVRAFNLQSYSFDWTKDFVVIGSGPSAGRYQFDPEKINVFCINRSILKVPDAHAAVTLSNHAGIVKRWAERVGCVNLIVIRNKEIWKYKLIAGDSLDLFVRFLVKRMPPGKNIFIEGVEMSYLKKWAYQVNNLRSTVIEAENRRIGIYKLCRNPLLDGFIPTIRGFQ
jgi:hypothetical protein